MARRAPAPSAAARAWGRADQEPASEVERRSPPRALAAAEAEERTGRSGPCLAGLGERPSRPDAAPAFPERRACRLAAEEAGVHPRRHRARVAEAGGRQGERLPSPRSGDSVEASRREAAVAARRSPVVRPEKAPPEDRPGACPAWQEAARPELHSREPEGIQACLTADRPQAAAVLPLRHRGRPPEGAEGRAREQAPSSEVAERPSCPEETSAARWRGAPPNRSCAGCSYAGGRTASSTR